MNMTITRPDRKVAAIRRKLPDDLELPAEFPGFVALVTHPKSPVRDVMNVTWSDPRPLLNADKSITREFVPFLTFSDGGVAALWVDDSHLRVVTCDSEGQHQVLAMDFGDFIRRMASADAELLERLELDAPLDDSELALVHRRKPRKVPTSTQKAFSRWVASHALDAKTTQTNATAALSTALNGIALRMLEDGLSKVHKPDSPRWTMSFELKQAGSKWTVTYLDYGKWRRVPAKYGFATLLPGLLAAMKTRKKSYDLAVWKDGRVFADRGNELSINA